MSPHPPAICRSAGTSLNRKSAKTAAATGSHSLEADTKEGEKNFRHQLKILCPRSVENTASKSPTTTEAAPYPVKERPLTAVEMQSTSAQNNIYNIRINGRRHMLSRLSADQCVDSGEHGRRQSQPVAGQMISACGIIRQCNEQASRYRNRNTSHRGL